jgi:predicted nucleotide-binding protein
MAKPTRQRKPRFRQVYNEHEEKGPFKVFLIHGRSPDWQKVKRFIVDELRFDVTVIVEEFTGKTIIQKIRDSMWYECDCAVAILSADDLLADQTRNARPNVLFEIGYCMGFFDYRYWEDDDIEPVILIMEDQTQIPSDFKGIEYLEYSRSDGIETTFGRLGPALERMYDQVAEYFKQEEADDV